MPEEKKKANLRRFLGNLKVHLKTKSAPMVAQEGRLRMAFTVTALFADTSPESLMALLLRQNPGLPSGALLFVSRVRSSGGGWSIFVDVDRRGLGYLRCLGTSCMR